MSEASQRLFFALWPDRALQQQWAAQVRERLPAKLGRAVSPDNLHITLVFLGDVDAERRACIETVADSVYGRRFELTMDRIGYWRRPQVLWLAPEETPTELARLAADLNAALKRCGYQPEQRPYRAHMTLMRKVRRGPGVVQFDPVRWSPEGFSLISSRLLPSGPEYTLIRSWPLN